MIPERVDQLLLAHGRAALIPISLARFSRFCLLQSAYDAVAALGGDGAARAPGGRVGDPGCPSLPSPLFRGDRYIFSSLICSLGTPQVPPCRYGDPGYQRAWPQPCAPPPPDVRCRRGPVPCAGRRGCPGSSMRRERLLAGRSQARSGATVVSSAPAIVPRRRSHVRRPWRLYSRGPCSRSAGTAGAAGGHGSRTARAWGPHRPRPAGRGTVRPGALPGRGGGTGCRS